MEFVKQLQNSKILVIGESYHKTYASPMPFLDEQSSTALRIGIQTHLPKELGLPDYIEIRNPMNVDISKEEVSEIESIISNGNYTHVLSVGRTPVKLFFESLSKGRTMEEMVGSPLLSPAEYPSLKVGVLPHYKSAFSKDSEDPLTDYWDKIKFLFSDRPNYDCEAIKIDNEEEFVQLLYFLDQLPKDKIIGLDYETNAVDPFNVDFRVTMYGLAYTIDKHNAKGFWYHPPKNEPLSPETMKVWKWFLDRNYSRMWAYNVAFEMKATWDQVGEMYRMNDAMVLMTVQGKRGSLKNVMRTELGASLWESSVHEFMAITEAMYKYTTRSKNRDTILDMFKARDIEGLRQFHPNFDKWFNQILEDYDREDLFHALDNYPYPWASVPPHVLGPYCAKDAGFALLLVENFNDPCYHKSYDFTIFHPWLAVKFEVNGVPWNDEIASKLEEEMGKQMLDHLYNVIDNLTTISAEDKLLASDIYHRELPYEVISYTEKTKKEKRRIIATNYDKIEELKVIFNPGSNTEESRSKFWDSYLNNDIILGTIMNIFVEDMEFNQSLKPLYDIVGTDFIKKNSIQTILEKFSDPDSFIKDRSIANQCKRSLQKAMAEYQDNLGKFASDMIKNQYQVHKRWLGLDITDQSTWSREWKLVFDLFLYKKIAKTVSTNINGKTGRSLVAEVVGEKWGKPLRGRYFEDKPTDESWDNVKCVLNTNFNTLSADTGRWSSGYHCLVGNTEIAFNQGKNLTIEELYNLKLEGKFPTKRKVKSVIEGTTTLITDTISDVLLSGYVDKTVRITLENGKVVEGTPNHRMLKTDGTYIQLQDVDETTELAEIKSYTIYKLIHTSDPNKWYIGVTGTSIKERLRMHLKGMYTVENLKPIYDKYGKNGWVISPLVEGVLSKRLAYQIEEDLIKKYKTTDPNFGYNKFSSNREIANNTWKSKSGEILIEERKSRSTRLGESYKNKLSKIQSDPSTIRKRQDTYNKRFGHLKGTGAFSSYPIETIAKIKGFDEVILIPKNHLAKYLGVNPYFIKAIRSGQHSKVVPIKPTTEEIIGALKTIIDLGDYSHILNSEDLLVESTKATKAGNYCYWLRRGKDESS